MQKSYKMIYPNVTASIDLSGSTVSVIPVSDTEIQEAHIRLTCLKASFFTASGIGYSVNKNVKNVVTAVNAIAKSNIASDHIRTRAGNVGLSSWILKSGNLTDITYTFAGGAQRTLKYDVTNVVNVLGNFSSLGKHIVLLATNLLTTKRPSTETEIFTTTTVASLSSLIEVQISNLIATTLSSQANQQTILNDILMANGPIISEAGGIITYTAAMSDIDILIRLKNVKFNVQYGSKTPQILSIDSIPICIRLVSS